MSNNLDELFFRDIIKLVFLDSDVIAKENDILKYIDTVRGLHSLCGGLIGTIIEFSLMVEEELKSREKIELLEEYENEY